VFKHLVKEKGIEHLWESDSAGTSAYHIGDTPDNRSMATCKEFISDVYQGHRARQLSHTDFSKFDYILCMDDENLYNVNDVKTKGSKATVKLLGEYDPEGMRIIADPYYGGRDGFVVNFNQIKRACEAFLKQHTQH